MPPIEWDLKHIFFWFEVFWVVVVTPAAIYYSVIRPYRRPKPEGYIGKFRRPDGEIVHVMRMASGRLWVCSEEKPGVVPRDLGYVSGRELTRWHKLATSPDGQDSVTRPN